MKSYLHSPIGILTLVFAGILIFNVLFKVQPQKNPKNHPGEGYTIVSLKIGTQEISFKPFFANPNDLRGVTLSPESKEYIMQLLPVYLGEVPNVGALGLFEPARVFTQLGVTPKMQLKDSLGRTYDLFPKNINFEWRPKSFEDPMYIKYSEGNTPFPLVRFIIQPANLNTSHIALSCPADACFPPLINHLYFRFPIRVLEIIDPIAPLNKKAA